MTEPGPVAGVGIGTTGVKVAAVDAAAVCHVSAEREYSTHSPRPGGSEQDLDEVAVAAADAVREVAAGVRVSGWSIAGVAFSSAMHSLIALGSDGARLTPSATWADGRTAEQARRLRASGDRAAPPAGSPGAGSGVSSWPTCWAARSGSPRAGRAR